jgi:hypothetical protein
MDTELMTALGSPQQADCRPVLEFVVIGAGAAGREPYSWPSGARLSIPYAELKPAADTAITRVGPTDL